MGEAAKKWETELPVSLLLKDRYENEKKIKNINIKIMVLNGKKDKIVKLKASCVFQEPQFDSRLVQIVVESTNAQIGILDPLGVNIKSGENFYLQLLKNMAKSLKDCLG